MKIFVVRHGETLLNRNNVHQTPNTELTEVGVEHAQKLANRLKKETIDKVYVSPLRRAQQTAEIIAQELAIPLTTCNELKEIKRPSLIVGKNHDEPSVIATKRKIEENYSNANWHHSDEENFFDLKKRTEKLLEGIEKEDNNTTILLVTHGYIAKLICAYILLGDNLTPQSFLHFYHHSEFSNTGLSSFEYNRDTGFRLLTWNDIQHK